MLHVPIWFLVAWVAAVILTSSRAFGSRGYATSFSPIEAAVMGAIVLVPPLAWFGWLVLGPVVNAYWRRRRDRERREWNAAHPTKPLGRQ